MDYTESKPSISSYTATSKFGLLKYMFKKPIPNGTETHHQTRWCQTDEQVQPDHLRERER